MLQDPLPPVRVRPCALWDPEGSRCPGQLDCTLFGVHPMASRTAFIHFHTRAGDAGQEHKGGGVNFTWGSWGCKRGGGGHSGTSSYLARLAHGGHWVPQSMR